MQLKSKLILILALFTILSKGLLANTGILWNETNKAIASKAFKNPLPDKFRTVQINYADLKNELAKAPTFSFINQAKSTGVVLDIPLPYGGVESFRIVETPMMEEGLANRYPEIKTYTGISISNPLNTVKIDVGYMGFHALVFSTDGRYYVEPISKDNRQNYLVFYANDYPELSQSPICNMENDEILNKENSQNVERYLANKNSADEIQYRAYRMAVSCTIEYAQASTGSATPTKAMVLSKVVTTINRVNGLYEREVAVHFNLIANTDTLFYLTGADPFTNESGGTMLGENQTLLTAKIGNANYDIGHSFSTGPGGIASLAAICVNARKAMGVTGLPNPVGIEFDIDFLSHEVGHMFGANHTFNSITGGCNGNRNGGTAYEPGGGSTIMAYYTQCGVDVITNVGDRVFHASALDEIQAFITTGAGNVCPVKTPTGNFPPVVEAGPDYIIPINTPFSLTGSAVDPDGDSLLYNWVEMDLGAAGGPNAPVGNAPTFRSFPPATTTTRIFPRLSNVLANSQTKGEKMASYPRSMVMRLLARDPSAMAGTFGFDNMKIDVVSHAGPFNITSTNFIDTFYVGTTRNIFWNVANTTAAPLNCSKVRISFSTDGGNTFPIILIDSTENDGSASFVVPNTITALGRIKVQPINNIFFDINNASISVINPVSPDYSLFSRAEKLSICVPDSAEIKIITSSLLNFSSPITLSVAALPAGAVAGSFSKNPVMPGDTSFIKISSLGLIAGNKTLKVNALANGISHSSTVDYVIAPKLTAQSTMSSPAQQQLNVIPNINFAWSVVTGANIYRLQIALDTNMNNLFLDTIILGGTTTSIGNLSLPQYKKLYTRIAAQNDCGDAPFSTITSFTTGGVPATPTGLKKLSNTGTSLTIRWVDNANNESSYKVERSDGDNSHYTQVASLSTDAKQYVSNNLVVGVLYYFKVRCANLAGFSNYSDEIAVGLNVGVDAKETLSLLSVYPNPANELVTVNLSNELTGNLSLQIVDELGRIVWNENLLKDKEDFSKEIDISKLPKGVYFLKIKTEENHWVSRMIKL